MSTLPMYVWVIVLVGLIGTTATICVMLWRGALTAGVLRFAPRRTLPGVPMAVIAGLAVAFVITRVLPIARILAEPDALWGLTLPQMFRPVGAACLVAMALGQLPAVFAVPAGSAISRSGSRPRLSRAPFGGARLLLVWPSTAAISTLPLVPIPTAVVPPAVTLHVLSLRKLRSAVQTRATTATPVRSTP